MQKRPHCPRCGLPKRSCLCGWIRPTANPQPLLILQHPAEAAQAKGSVRLLRLSLLNNRVQTGTTFEPKALDGLLNSHPVFGPVHSVLLYPGEVAAKEEATAPPAAAGTLQRVLLDGTWRQSRQMLALNPALQALPRRALVAPPASRYAMRKAHHAEQRSSLEAACFSLAESDPEIGRYAALLQAFGGWVAECLNRVQRVQ